jgi:hypothetical protein
MYTPYSIVYQFFRMYHMPYVLYVLLYCAYIRKNYTVAKARNKSIPTLG